MADLVKVTKLNGDEIVVTYSTAKTMKENNELLIPAKNDSISPQDVFGDDYESSGTLSGT